MERHEALLFAGSAATAALAGAARAERRAVLRKRRFLRVLAIMVGFAAPFLLCQNASNVVRPGEVWLDDRGRSIQAHGGGILLIKDTYFWFGEDRSQSNDPDKRYVSCYASKDLIHWKFRGQVLAIANPENLGEGAILERPKVFYSPLTKSFVMYMHLDSPGYKLARVAIAISKKVDGTYTYVRSFRPLDEESRDIGQFVDDDGSAYLIFESRPTKGFFIAKLTPDRMSIEKKMSFVPVPLEGGAIVHYKGLYYVMGSHLTGWKPNPNVYATAPSLAGPWSTFQDIAPRETNTYDSQSSMLIRVTGTKSTTVIYVGDRWSPATLWDSRYIWMPLQIGGGRMTLPEPGPWTIDVKTGIATSESLTDRTPALGTSLTPRHVPSGN